MKRLMTRQSATITLSAAKHVTLMIEGLKITADHSSKQSTCSPAFPRSTGCGVFDELNTGTDELYLVSASRAQLIEDNSRYRRETNNSSKNDLRRDFCLAVDSPCHRYRSSNVVVRIYAATALQNPHKLSHLRRTAHPRSHLASTVALFARPSELRMHAGRPGNCHGNDLALKPRAWLAADGSASRACQCW